MSETKSVSRLQSVKLALCIGDETIKAPEFLALKAQCEVSKAPRGSWNDFTEDCVAFLNEQNPDIQYVLLPDAQK